MKVLGIVGWSGSGKTTLVTALIPCFGALVGLSRWRAMRRCPVASFIVARLGIEIGGTA